jgi:hypothetical protein
MGYATSRPPNIWYIYFVTIPYVADKAYYVYLPTQPQYITHHPSVKGFKHHDGYGLGMRLVFTWLDR